MKNIKNSKVINCECGKCELKIVSHDKQGRPRRFIRGHNIIVNNPNKVDHSKRKCSICGSSETWINPKTGIPYWHGSGIKHNLEESICMKCYQKIRYRKKKKLAF